MKETLYKFYETSIDLLNMIEVLSVNNNMLDDQKYLDWKDAINRISIDLDRF